MAEWVSVGEMASAIMESLEEYADLATEDLKKAVRSAGNTVKKEIRENAPKRTGAYGKSWAVKVSKETSNSLEVTVYSRNRYWLAHLPGSRNFAADGRVYYKGSEVRLEVYTDRKDLGLEARVEAVLDGHGVFYNKSEVWIEGERLYEVLYSFGWEAG